MRITCGLGCPIESDNKMKGVKYAPGATASVVISTPTLASFAMKKTKVGAVPNIGAGNPVSLAAILQGIIAQARS